MQFALLFFLVPKTVLQSVLSVKVQVLLLQDYFFVRTPEHSEYLGNQYSAHPMRPFLHVSIFPMCYDLQAEHFLLCLQYALRLTDAPLAPGILVRQEYD